MSKRGPKLKPERQAQYDVIREWAVVDLISRVDMLMSEGWKPTGGIVITESPHPDHMGLNKTQYLQAVCRD